MTGSATRRVFLALLMFLGISAQAQVRVDIAFKRNLYMLYEPIMCTVTITNQTGRTLELADTPRDKWFSFQIETTSGIPLPPVNPDYQNQPVTIESGQKLVRTINLTPLYPLSEFGTYRVQAAVFPAQIGRMFVSPKLNIDITEGRLLWQESVGVPEGAGAGSSRTYSILAHRLPQTTMLYLRVEDKDAGIIYCTTQLGRFITFGSPDVVIDATNQVHILQNTAPRAFLYSHINVNGKIQKQQAYQVFKERPYLVKQDNAIAVVGGVPYDPNAKTPEELLPKLGDRPVPMPTPQGKPTPEDKRPENLLSR
ncbi:MAG: hypothetical protein ACOYMS_06960 [Terrimicrobiaceae bacterium]